MTHPATPVNGSDRTTGAACARADALAGLARQVDDLQRRLDPLDPVPARVAELAGMIGQLTAALDAVTTRPAPVPAPSWLLAPTDPVEVEHLVTELAAWLAAVLLRYPDAAAVLPPCWLYHPDVVEELLWLMHAWCAAYQGPAASVTLAGDWHDRQRPGVIRRLAKSVGACSIETHLTRPDWDQYPTGAPPVPGMSEVTGMARWWAHHRDQPAPEPTNPAAFTPTRTGARR